MSTVWALDFNSTGQHIVSCSDDKSIRFWTRDPNASGKKGKEAKFGSSGAVVDSHTRPVYDVAWSKVSDVIATACGDNCVRVFKQNVESSDLPDVPNFELSVKQCDAHEGDVNAVSWNPKIGEMLASCGDDGVVKIWQYEI
jgi:WD40 repeat protein